MGGYLALPEIGYDLDSPRLAFRQCRNVKEGTAPSHAQVLFN